MNSPEQIVPEFPEWPVTWSGTEDDIPYGNGLIEEMRPFIINLIDQGLKVCAVRKHMNNLWLLGGEIIRSVNTHDDYKIPPAERLRRSVDQNGGLYCQHLATDEEVRSYDATSRKLSNFLESKE
jgi:hypothetical protein